jgi:hypothetical protein
MCSSLKFKIMRRWQMVGVSKAARNGVARKSHQAKMLAGYLGFCGIIVASIKLSSTFEEVI